MKSQWDQLRQTNQQTMTHLQSLADRQQQLTDFQVNLNQQQIVIANNYQHDFDGLQAVLHNQADLAQVAYKVGDSASRVDEIVAQYAADFKAATKLTKKDFTFLFTATALQVVRQYVFAKINQYRAGDRQTDQQAAKDAGAHDDPYNRDTRNKGYYHTTIDEIIHNPVPFDTQNGSGAFGVNLGAGKGHRFHTLGHDAMLGWIFGTANIATRTVTLSDFVSSYHVQYGHYMTGTGNLSKSQNDYFSAHADTLKVLDYGLVENAKHLTNGLLATALVAEGVHLKSDIDSRQSLGLPGLQAVDPKLAEKLSDYGLNMHNLKMFGEQAMWSVIINLLISMIHRLLYNEETDGDIELYKVRTRKIISYSNVIASASNIIYVAVASYLGDGNAINALDIGGLLVTIATVLRNGKVQRDIFEEFMANRWYNEIMSI